MMKTRRSLAETIKPTLDQNYINGVYESLMEKMEDLDQLNKDYKIKQETHFLNTFMHIIQKIGNQLLLAQEAYKNVDMEVKKDDYYVQLASELNFFKKDSFELKQKFTNAQKELKKVRLDKSSFQTEIQHYKELYQKKCQETFEVKSQNKLLKMKIKGMARIISGLQGKQGENNVLIKNYKIIEKRKELITKRIDKVPDELQEQLIKKKQICRGDLLPLEYSIPSNRKPNYQTLSPMKNQKRQHYTRQTFRSVNRSIRTKNTSRDLNKILGQDYCPQTTF